MGFFDFLKPKQKVNVSITTHESTKDEIAKQYAGYCKAQAEKRRAEQEDRANEYFLELSADDIADKNGLKPTEISNLSYSANKNPRICVRYAGFWFIKMLFYPPFYPQQNYKPFLWHDFTPDRLTLVGGIFTPFLHCRQRTAASCSHWPASLLRMRGHTSAR